LSREHKLPQWVAFGQEIQGWVACRAGNTAAGLDLMEQAMAQLHATGARSHSSRMLANLAEGYLAAGRPELARLRLDAALQHRVQHGEHYYAPELYRLQALILEAEGAHPQKVGASLMQALAIARVQQAGLLTLRAAVALGKYSLERGNAKAARDLIEPLCQATREGGDLPDFTEALGLLHAVSGVARSTRAAP
jgi:predicted ATPase